MTPSPPTRVPTRFVFIRGLVSPKSVHLNGELARVEDWLLQRKRFCVSPCSSVSKSDNYTQVYVKETNIVDACDDDVVSYVLTRMDDTRLERPGGDFAPGGFGDTTGFAGGTFGGFHRRFRRLHLLL